MWCQPWPSAAPAHQPSCTTSPRPKLGNQPRPRTPGSAGCRSGRWAATPQQRQRHEQLAHEAAAPRAPHTPPMGTPSASAMKAATSDSSSVPESARRSGARPWRPGAATGRTRPAPHSPGNARTAPRRACPAPVRRASRPPGRRGVLPEQDGHRVAHELKQHEGNEGHGDHDDHGLQEAAQYEGKHCCMSAVGRAMLHRPVELRQSAEQVFRPAVGLDPEFLESRQHFLSGTAAPPQRVG